MKGNRINSAANLPDSSVSARRRQGAGATQTLFGDKIERFLADLEKTPQGLDFLSTEDPCARSIRTLTWLLTNWPYPHAPWSMLESCFAEALESARGV